jgi:hypothetical protein
VAVNIYARESQAFDDDSRSAAARFAPYAAVAIASMHEYESAKDLAGNLQVALLEALSTVQRHLDGAPRR